LIIDLSGPPWRRLRRIKSGAALLGCSMLGRAAPARHMEPKT
jgi:hypothetical protein